MKTAKVTRKLKEQLRRHFSNAHNSLNNLPPELERLPEALIKEEYFRMISRNLQKQDHSKGSYE
jgi:hypothetical protein